MYSSRLLKLILLKGEFAVCQLDADSGPPDWVFNRDFYSITRTSDEISFICRQDQLPGSQPCEPGWRILEIKGPFNFNEIGVLSSLLEPLASAGISILAISTYNTDYLLVKKHHLDQAILVLQTNGHEIEQQE